MRRKEKKKIFDINNINKKTLNIIGVILSIIIIIIVTVYYSLNMNREYINGDKKLPFLIEKNTIITVLDGKRKTLENDKENEMLEIGIIDDIYIDLKLNDEKNNKIKSIILDKFDIKNEFEDVKKIKIVPITENIVENKDGTNENNDKIEFKIENKNNEENSKIRVGFRLYHEKISEKKIKKDEIVTYGKGLIENNNDIEKYNLSKINFDINIIMDNNEEYKTNMAIDKVGMERKEFGLFKEENEKKVKIVKKYLQN